MVHILLSVSIVLTLRFLPENETCSLSQEYFTYSVFAAMPYIRISTTSFKASA